MKPTLLQATVAASIVSLGALSPAYADLSGVTGSVLVIAPPPSVAIDVLESNTNIFLFTERTTLTLPVAVTPSITVPGTYPPNALTPTTLPVGTLVDTF